MYIRDILIENPVFLAPMAGVTDFVYRKLCFCFGSGGSVTELISAKAVIYGNKGTDILMYTDGAEGISGLQLFGSEPEIIAEAACMLSDRLFSFVDINMGCPVPKVVKNGEGAALMNDPSLVFKIVDAVVKGQKKPVTVKIRSGFTKENINADEVALAAEAAGASAVFVHARTRSQYYSGEADLNVIKKVKNAVKIPVIGNGDITGKETAKKMIDETGCDGIMVGRAARGNPWIFEELKEIYKVDDGGDICSDFISEDDKKSLKAVIFKHAEELVKFKGEYKAVRELRKHISWYTAGIRSASTLRQEINKCETLQELKKIVGDI